MPEQSIEELKQLSLPALRHAELVNLARTESPNKAYELTSIRWPRRQAKATRSLAILRRDHGPEALEAFVMEHARPNGSEHAQGDSQMTFETVYPDDVRNVAFVHSRFQVESEDTLHIRHFTGNTHTDVKLLDEIARFGLDEPQTRMLISRIVKAMLAQWANPKAQQYGHMWSSALLAMRQYGMDASSPAVFQRTLLATVIYHGGHEEHINNFVNSVLPNPIAGSTLQDIINYLLEMGCTEDEVRSAWVEMIRTRQRDNFLTAWIVGWWRGLTIGKRDLIREVEPIARQLILNELRDALVHGYSDWNQPGRASNGRATESFMELMEFLASYNLLTENEETQELIESYFVECLVRGKIGTAFFMLIRFGRYFRLWSEHANERFNSQDTPNGAMQKLIRVALAKCDGAHRYGTAAALAEHLGETEEADRLRSLARHFKQSVTLDCAFYNDTKE